MRKYLPIQVNAVNVRRSMILMLTIFIFLVCGNAANALLTPGHSHIPPAFSGNDKSPDLLCSPLSGAYTINKNNPSGGSNFNSFKDLADTLTLCGVGGPVTVTVAVGTGPYTEQVIFQNIPGLGTAAPITINGSGEIITSDTAIIQTGSNPNRYIIRLIDLQYFTINNLKINMVAGSTGFIGVHILNSGNHITVSNCMVDMGTATSTLLGAFVANGAPASILTPGGNFDFISITGNTTTGGGYGASVVGLTSPLATNIVISNNTINDFNSNGVYLRETNGVAVSANNFDKSAGSVSSTNAIQLAQSANINGRVFGNFIKMSQTTGSLVGIYLFAGTGHKVYNNLIYNIKSLSGTVEGIRVRTGGSAPEIYFNTISFDNATAGAANFKGFREELSNTGSILRNNIFSLTHTTSGVKTGIELASTSTVTTAISSNYNVFWIPGGNVATRSTTSYAALSNWQTASSQDAASFETDPSFVSVTNPVPRSGVINNQAVTGTGVTTDITGATRGAAPDPGAYEFSPPSADAAITNFILPAIPHCANTLSVQFELTNAGADPLNTVTINWTVNGVLQAPVNWAGPTLASGLSTNVTLGTVPVTGSNIYNFTAISSNPNGGPDANPSNDSYTYNGFRRGMEGVLTINASAPVSPLNYLSFQAIANDLSQHGVCSPVTINVLNGPYTEQVVFSAIPGTNSVNRVTLNGNSQILQYNPTVAGSDHVLQLNGVNYMTVQNLTVNSLHPTQGRGIHITNGASKLLINNNNVNVSLTNSTSSSFGIIISGANWLLDGSLSDSVVITNNTVTGGYSAIQLSGVHWTTPLTRITVANNNVLDWYGFGVYLSYTNGTVVRKNIIRRPTRTNSGSDAVTPAGITVPAGSLLFLLEKNRIYDLHANMPGTPTISRGVYMSGTTTAPTSGTIQNNLVYGMNNDGAQYGIQNNSVTGPVNIYHNTIVLNNATGASTSNTNAINLSNFSTQSGIEMKNNTFVLTRGGTGVKRIIDVSASSAPLTSNYNATYLNAPGGTQTFGQIGSTNYITLNDWQTQTGKDVNSVHADPLFVNPATGNFTPTSAAVDGGTMGTSAVGGIIDDILDIVRSVNPDPGAFEFAVPPCSGANGGTASTSSGPFCTSGSGSITATGYSSGPGTNYQWQFSNDNFVTNINDLASQNNPASASTGIITSTTYYRLKVVCANGPVTAFSNIVFITVNLATAISVQPFSQTVCAGANVTFSVTASGSNLNYQWRKNSTNISGATSASYTITGVVAGDAGNYDVVVTGGCGNATSSAAVLTVNAATSITTQPSSQTACVGANVTLNVVVSGSLLTYQWRKNSTNISGATSASYTITSIVAGDAGSYSVVVTGSCGSVNSALAVLSVNTITAITTQPVSQTVCAGSNVTFNVVASGASLTYQWRKNSTNITGAVSASYTITGVVAGDAGNYDVAITGSCGNATSTIAILSVTATGSWTGVTNTNWNTASNWCGGIPTATSDITIPASAPNMPSLSSGTGTVRNVTIASGASLIVGTGGTLDIYGNVTNSGTFNSAAGNLAFKGTSQQTIPAFTCINAQMNGNGGVLLAGNAAITGQLTLTSGHITLANNNLTLSTGSTGSLNSHIITNATGSVIVSNLAASSTRVIPVGINATSYNPVTLVSNAAHTTDNFSVQVKQGVAINGTGGTLYTDYVVDRTWMINEDVAGGSNVNINLQWNGLEELTGFDRSRSYIMRHNGSNWIAGPSTGASGVNPYNQSLSGVTSFSPFAVRTEPIPRPITGIYPNPAIRYINVVLDLPNADRLTFSIYDAIGRLVQKTERNIASGLTSSTLNLDNLSAGMYLLKVSTKTNDQLLIQRFVKKL